MMSRDVSALILAGGRATRFGGVAKHEILVEGQTIFSRQVAVLAPRVAEIIVSSQRDITGFRTVHDAMGGIGPLAGIAAGLAACRTKWLLVVAGDMPYITDELVERLIAPTQGDQPPRRQERKDQSERVSDPVPDPILASSASWRFKSSELDVVGIRMNGLPEPLVCVLHTRALPILERRIATGDFKASRLLTDDALRVRWIDGADPSALRNINSPEDLGR